MASSATTVDVISKPGRTSQVVPGRRRGTIIRVALCVIGCIYALFPIVVIVSASLDAANTLNGQGLLPRNASLANYTAMLSDPHHPFLRWIGTSMLVSSSRPL